MANNHFFLIPGGRTLPPRCRGGRRAAGARGLLRDLPGQVLRPAQQEEARRGHGGRARATAGVL